MNFQEAKELFKNKYAEIGLDTLKEDEKTITLQLNRMKDVVILVSEDTINEYVEFEKRRSEFVNRPSICCICSKNYREQMIVFVNKRYKIHESEFVFESQNDDSLEVRIGLATNDYLNFFRFHKEYLNLTKERLRRMLLGRSEKIISSDELLYRPTTIAVNNLQKTNVEKAILASDQIFDNCFFTLSYIKDEPLQLSEAWPFRYLAKEPFKFEHQDYGDALKISQENFNSNLIRYYHRGLTNGDPVNQYLAFYNVLEFFFIDLSNENLHKSLAQILSDPKFSNSAKYLNKLVLCTVNHKRETDETKMLTLILEEFVLYDDLVTFIREYEEFLQESIFTKKHALFGKSVEVKLEEGHIFSNLATRIKTIRNALVHSADKFEGQERYIPNTASERKIELENPLMRYLAERVIIGSSQRT